MICVHCGAGLVGNPYQGLYTHATGLQRCQDSSVPYLHMGHPEMPCPSGLINPCVGYQEINCTHVKTEG